MSIFFLNTMIDLLYCTQQTVCIKLLFTNIHKFTCSVSLSSYLYSTLFSYWAHGKLTHTVQEDEKNTKSEGQEGTPPPPTTTNYHPPPTTHHHHHHHHLAGQEVYQSPAQQGTKVSSSGNSNNNNNDENKDKHPEGSFSLRNARQITKTLGGYIRVIHTRIAQTSCPDDLWSRFRSAGRTLLRLGGQLQAIKVLDPLPPSSHHGI